MVETWDDRMQNTKENPSVYLKMQYSGPLYVFYVSHCPLGKMESVFPDCLIWMDVFGSCLRCVLRWFDVPPVFSSTSFSLQLQNEALLGSVQLQM
jgi:hypothetical protein